MKITRHHLYALGTAVAAGVAAYFVFRPVQTAQQPAIVTRQLVIDDNVMSPTFGLSIPQTTN